MSKDRLQQELKQAMRDRNKARVDALRLITAAVKQIEVDERIDVSDERLITILSKMAKQRKESIAQYQKAERQDLVEQEQFELEIITQFLPEALSEQEILQVIESACQTTGASTIKDMGKLMAAVKEKLQGRADMTAVSVLIKNKLSH